MCREVGLPPGVLNVLTGLGPEAGAPLASHPHVDKVNLMEFNDMFIWVFDINAVVTMISYLI